MILHPWILGLAVGHSTLLLLFSLCVLNAWQIFRGWDYNSTGENQFLLEKKTYLISSIINFTLFVQILMLFLFEITADELANVLPGAMCAVGTLSSNNYGFLLLNLKIVSTFVYFMWLVINYLDNQMETYPLVKKKYLALILIYPLPIMEIILFFKFAFHLDPSVITSCCGSVFNESAKGIGGSLANSSASISLSLFFCVAFLLLGNRYITCRWGRGHKRLGALLEFPFWILFFITAILVTISFISTYVYEMVSHNCLFCFIGSQYHYYGVFLYFSLFIATGAGMTGGLLEMITKPAILAKKARLLQKKMHTVSFYGMMLFLVTGFWPFIVYYIKTGRLI
ncbi:MAG: hypothetical protein GY699_15100 [Desulfobacteraceae bacterium]|nr:hypothetical protein [Desulfobacteraceae bacterium]